MEEAISILYALAQLVYVLGVFAAAVIVTRRYVETRHPSTRLLAFGFDAMAIGQLISIGAGYLIYAVYPASESGSSTAPIEISGIALLVPLILNIAGIVLLIFGAIAGREETAPATKA